MAHDSISHFSHPEHELVKRHYPGPFSCCVCREYLSGPGYGCRAGCEFGMHDSCAGHAQTLSCPAHHAHQLVLYQTAQHLTYTCDVCAGRCEPGCFLYRCRPCGFDMHPRCAQLPPVVRSARHQEHDLTLVVGEGRCAACNRCTRRGWLYRCTVCRGLDFHVSCAAAWPGQEQDGGQEQGPCAGARGEKNAGRYEDGVAVTLANHNELEAQLLRSRIAAQSHMATAVAMANMGYSLSRLA